MNKAIFWKHKLFLPLVLLNIALLVAVVFFINHAQKLLVSDVKITLTEVVTQNKDIITGRVSLDINKLNAVADKIDIEMKTRGIVTQAQIKDFLLAYNPELQKQAMFLSGKDGLTVVSGKAIDISGRKYFRLAMQGTSNISDKTISRVNGEEIFVISVPLYKEQEIIGSLQKIYTLEQMHQLFALSLFSAQGYVYVLNSEGYIILHTIHDNCYTKSDNYFRDMYASGNQQASEQLKIDISNNKSGFMETNLGNGTVFSAYTPLPAIHDWYLITSVPTEAISPNGTTVLMLFFLVLCAITFIFTSSIAYFQHYKNQQKLALEQLAFVDPITGGNTFNKFLIDVQSILASNIDKRFWLLKFDIDNFKYINNFYGFEFGDKILKQINKSISDKLHKKEITARMSSDNFVVLLDDSNENRLHELLAFNEQQEDLTIYCSAGVYTIHNHEENINLMVDKAGTASQTVKGALNKKIGYYSDEFDKRIRHNEQLKRQIKLAIEEKRFVPYYQPKVNINTGEIVGAEALARMFDKTGKLISPAEFIPICEKTGLIIDVDMIIFEKVLTFLQKSLAQGIECTPISVNFSRLHLTDPEFTDKIIAKLKLYNVPSELLEIELTESVFFDNVDIIRSIAQKLHSHGCLIAMDDFGSGYSSLNMLKDVPIDVLKVDKGFLDEAADNERRNIIFSTIADMAQKLDIKIVVEGVEYPENVQLMKDCGCHIAQGYYFARPMPEQDFEKIYKDGVI